MIKIALGFLKLEHTLKTIAYFFGYYIDDYISARCNESEAYRIFIEFWYPIDER